MTLDERDLRAGLRALTAAPPPAPPDRVVRSARRWRWIQLRRAGVATVTAFAVAVPVVALVRQQPSTGVARPAAFAGWPDRRDPAVRKDTDAILALTLADQSNLVDYHRTAYWLYAGRVEGTRDAVVAVWAYCDAQSCDDVVLAYADSSIQQGWDVEHGKFPKPGGAPLGWYFRGEHGGNVAFALGPKNADTIEVDGQVVRGRHGVFMAPLGYLDHGPDVVMRDGGKVLYRGPLTGRSDAPTVAFAAPAPAATAPAGYHVVTNRHGQGGLQLDPQPGPSAIKIAPGQRFRVYSRCVGGGRLFVVWTGEERAVPCDGAVHASAEYTATQVVIFNVQSDAYDTWSYVIATRT